MSASLSGDLSHSPRRNISGTIGVGPGLGRHKNDSSGSARAAMNRKQLLRAFYDTHVIDDAILWVISASSLLKNLQQATKDLQGTRYPYESILRLLVERMRRYLLALSQLAPKEDDGFRKYCIDGFHPILKSLFETLIEFELVLLYKAQFNGGANWANELEARIRTYTDGAQKKHNHKFLYRKERLKSFEMQLGEKFEIPPMAAEHLAGGIQPSTDRMNEIAKKLNGDTANFTDVNHWFPEMGPDGRYFSQDGKGSNKRPKRCGSMQWRCQFVLSAYLADTKRADWWDMAFDTQYDLLNRYSHPALGYDDSMRSQGERLKDLFDLLFGMMSSFERYILPSLRREIACLENLQEGFAQSEAQYRAVLSKYGPMLEKFAQSEYLPENPAMP